MIRSPIHFSGNKKRALDNGLKELVSPNGGKLLDMMVGSGAVLYNGGTAGSFGVDLDFRLIKVHKFFGDRLFPTMCLRTYKRYSHPRRDLEEQYYRLRDDFNEQDRNFDFGIEWAAKLVVLTQLSFNSLWRFSRNGYNVPYGHGLKQYDQQRIDDASQRCRDMDYCFYQMDVTRLTARWLLSSFRVGDGDVVYFDPPYYLSNYTYSGWSIEHDDKLLGLLVGLKEKTKVVLSNVAVYRGVSNDRLLDWADRYGFFIHVLSGVQYTAWKQAVSTVNHTGKTIEIAISNVRCDSLPLFDRRMISEDS